MKQTVLFQQQQRLKAKMTDFQGWQIPLQYSNVQDEYYAVRTAAGLFDIGYLGRIEVSGTGAVNMLQKIFTRDMSKLPEGTAQYGLICNESGGILNDGFIFRLPGNRYLFSTNPINTEKLLLRLREHAANDVQIADRTQTIAQFALQGPQSSRIIEKLAVPNFKEMKPEAVREMRISDTTVVVSRTSYTGEHGYELFMPADHAETLWDALLAAAGGDIKVLPCGLSCRDVLRLEMGYPLYGNDISETRTPLEAGLEAFIDFKKDFIGKDALFKTQAAGLKQKLAGFELLEKEAPKNGSSIFSENREIGIVTSGNRSPFIRNGIGLGYLLSRYAQPGQEIEIEIKEREIPARVVELPFYRKK